MIALAIAAHPDDIEFMLAGTLLQLKERGVQIHMLNLSSGSLGSATMSPEQTAKTRWEEAQASAKVAGAGIQPPLFDDLEVFYDRASLARVIAAVRRVQPDIVLTQYVSDYMEDHQNSTRLAVTAAFSRGIAHAPCEPYVAPYDKPVALYHALPHGLHDPLGRLVVPERFIDIAPVMEVKAKMLGCHKSQGQWLEDTQGMGAFESEMAGFAAQVGQLSGRFSHAEGLIKHLHLGFGPADFDPVADLLGEACLRNSNFSQTINATTIPL